LVAATPEVITPAVAPRVKQWDASTAAAIESFGSVAFEQIAAPAGKSEVVRGCEATPIRAGFNKVTELARRMCHLASSGLLG
jgi:hypothetical protein